MAIRINRERVSDRPWGQVDKTALRNRLAQALQDGVEGAASAIREVYAVIKADDLAEAPSQNWWGPHHELDGDEVILNRNGLLAAAQALLGARAEPDLTAAQRREAARHLLRHYRDLEEDPPERLRLLAGEQPSGEMRRTLAGQIAGEIRVEDIPVAGWADVEALKAGDDDPLEVVVEIPEGRSTRGWYYTRRVLERIAGEVNTRGLVGILGHQEPEKVSTEFVPPAVHWLGAKVVDAGGKAVLYVRGLIDKAQADLKRWIRGGAVRQVSIFGIPTLETVAGETRVTDFVPLSIDWTPLNRAGMPTRVVAVGEMGIDDSLIGGDEPVTWQELARQLAERVRSREATVAGVIGEMGLDLPTVAQAVAPEEWRRLEDAARAVGEMAEAAGLGPEATAEQVVARVKQALEAERQARKAQRDAVLDRVIGEMVAAEALRPVVRRLVEQGLGEDADEDAVRKAVGELLQAEDIRRAFGAALRETVPAPAGGNVATGGPVGLVPRGTRI